MMKKSDFWPWKRGMDLSVSSTYTPVKTVIQFYTDTMGLSCIRNIVSPQISHSESKIKVRVWLMQPEKHLSSLSRPATRHVHLDSPEKAEPPFS